MNTLVLRPAAAADIEDAHRWYEQQRPGLGDEFRLAIADALALVQAHPRAFPVVHRHTRRAFLKRFPYGLYYRMAGERLVVVACFHAKRNPRSWRARR